MRAINVWGGTHPEGWESQALIYELRALARRQRGVPVRARIAHKIGHSMARDGYDNLAFVLGNIQAAGTSDEVPCAEWIVSKSKKAYGTIDAHQILDFGLQTAYIDCTKGVSPLMLGFLRTLGIQSLISTKGWGMQAQIHNALLLESRYRPSGERATIAQAIRSLATDPSPPMAQAEDFDWYAYVDALSTSTLAQPSRIETAFRPLEDITDSVAAALGVRGVALHILNWREKPITAGVWGEVVTPISVPNTTYWPV